MISGMILLIVATGVFTEGHLIFWSVLAFVALLLLAFIYDWRKGVFKWR